MTRLRSTIAAALLVGVALVAPAAAHAADVDAVAPSAHLTLVLADPGDEVVVVGGQRDVVHRPAGVVEGHHPDLTLDLRLQSLGQARGEPAHQHRRVHEPLEDRVVIVPRDGMATRISPYSPTIWSSRRKASSEASRSAVPLPITARRASEETTSTVR